MKFNYDFIQCSTHFKMRNRIDYFNELTSIVTKYYNTTDLCLNVLR